MLDIAWSELLLVGVVALIVIGPRDLPHMFRALGRITGKARGMAREFTAAMEDAARDTGLDEASKSLNEIRDVTSKRSMGLDALDRAADKFEKWDPKIPSGRAKAKPDPAAPAPAGSAGPAGVEPAASAGSAETQGAQTGNTPAATTVAAKPDNTPAAAPADPGQPQTPGQRRLHAVRRSDSKDV